MSYRHLETNPGGIYINKRAKKSKNIFTRRPGCARKRKIHAEPSF
jgi:hypothetical protein